MDSERPAPTDLISTIQSFLRFDIFKTHSAKGYTVLTSWDLLNAHGELLLEEVGEQAGRGHGTLYFGHAAAPKRDASSTTEKLQCLIGNFVRLDFADD